MLPYFRPEKYYKLPVRKCRGIALEATADDRWELLWQKSICPSFWGGFSIADWILHLNDIRFERREGFPWDHKMQQILGKTLLIIMDIVIWIIMNGRQLTRQYPQEAVLYYACPITRTYSYRKILRKTLPSSNSLRYSNANQFINREELDFTIYTTPWRSGNAVNIVVKWGQGHWWADLLLLNLGCEIGESGWWQQNCCLQARGVKMHELAVKRQANFSWQSMVERADSWKVFDVTKLLSTLHYKWLYSALLHSTIGASNDWNFCNSI